MYYFSFKRSMLLNYLSGLNEKEPMLVNENSLLPNDNKFQYIFF